MKKVCRYCGQSFNGGGQCAYSPLPNKVHKFITSWDSCVYCGRNSYGRSCPYSPEKGRHRHGHGLNKCVLCGSTNIGSGCPYGDKGMHER